MAKRKSGNYGTPGATSPPIDLLKASNQGSSNRRPRLAASGDLVRLQQGSQASAKPIQFGSPSDKGNKTSSSKKTGSSWTGLLESLSTGGLSDLFGGGGGIGAGLDYLSGGLQSIFGGTTESQESLKRFALPEVQDQTIYVNGTQVQTSSSGGSSGTYDNSQSIRLNQISKADIVQTIKTALLTSSSLNDVIGEL
ncbi:MAG: hypothetical protein ACJ746_27385 [Bryobacteraceae bacterium]